MRCARRYFFGVLVCLAFFSIRLSANSQSTAVEIHSIESTQTPGGDNPIIPVGRGKKRKRIRCR
jgi:hypothetical protein